MRSSREVPEEAVFGREHGPAVWTSDEQGIEPDGSVARYRTSVGDQSEVSSRKFQQAAGEEDIKPKFDGFTAVVCQDSRPPRCRNIVLVRVFRRFWRRNDCSP